MEITWHTVSRLSVIFWSPPHSPPFFFCLPWVLLAIQYDCVLFMCFHSLSLILKQIPQGNESVFYITQLSAYMEGVNHPV